MKLTQHDKIINHITKFGSIDSLVAFNEYRITQFHTRMKELKEKKGYNFQQKYDKKRKVNIYSFEIKAETLMDRIRKFLGR